MAWRGLYDRYAPIVHRFLSAFGVPREEREDACQEVFVAVYRSLARFRGEARLSTWIYRIAARHAGRIARRRRVRGLLSTLLVREPPPPPAPDPHERSERLQLLDEMIGKLSPKKRLVLVLFEIEGVPIEEIAEDRRVPREHRLVAPALRARRADGDGQAEDEVTPQRRWPDGPDDVSAELRRALDEAALRGPDDVTLRRGWAAVAVPPEPPRRMARRGFWFAGGVASSAALGVVAAVWLWPRAGRSRAGRQDEDPVARRERGWTRLRGASRWKAASKR